MSPQTDENKPAVTEKPLLQRLSKTYPKLIWAAISRNLQWKLLALLLAVLLWVGLILQDPSLTRERVFTDVPLTITGSDTLRRNGFIVTQGLEEEAAVVRLKVDVPQQEYNDVVYSNYNPRVDLSRITEAGEQTVKVSTTSTTLYGSVTDVSPGEIPIVVDNYITNYRIPVQVSVIGEYPDGFYGTVPTTDVSIVTVSGPESVVSKIAKIVLEYDVSALAAHAAALQTALTLRYMDIDNNELDDSLLEPTSGGVLLRSIVLEQKLYPIKTLSLNQTALTTGTPKTGYEVKSVTLSPGVVVAAGDETALSVLDTLFLEEAVDVSGRDAPFTAEIRILQPDNIVYLNTKTVTLIVDIGAVQKTQTFENIPISVTGIPDGMIAAAQTPKVSVTLTGPMLSLDTMASSKIKATVSAEGLSAGTFDLPVEITLSHSDADLFTCSVSPQTVSVAVAGK
ncbi:MAG: hypothetical protein JW811_01360 [Clostridiales bacterium]|nr:hypothetical protein [Clostridiales bacterium]